MPDAHGQAALMLCESLAHLLVERGVLGSEQVVGAIEGVVEIEREMAERPEAAATAGAAIALLTAVALSFEAA